MTDAQFIRHIPDAEAVKAGQSHYSDTNALCGKAGVISRKKQKNTAANSGKCGLIIREFQVDRQSGRRIDKRNGKTVKGDKKFFDTYYEYSEHGVPSLPDGRLIVGERGVFTEEGDPTAPDFIENITVKKSLLKSFDCCRLFKETIRFLRADAAHYKKSYRGRKPFRK